MVEIFGPSPFCLKNLEIISCVLRLGYRASNVVRRPIPQIHCLCRDFHGIAGQYDWSNALV